MGAHPLSCLPHLRLTSAPARATRTPASGTSCPAAVIARNVALASSTPDFNPTKVFCSTLYLHLSASLPHLHSSFACENRCLQWYRSAHVKLYVDCGPLKKVNTRFL